MKLKRVPALMVAEIGMDGYVRVMSKITETQAATFVEMYPQNNVFLVHLTTDIPEEEFNGPVQGREAGTVRSGGGADPGLPTDAVAERAGDRDQVGEPSRA